MAVFQKWHNVEISPEEYLRKCSNEELAELNELMQSTKVMARLYPDGLDAAILKAQNTEYFTETGIIR